MRIMPITATRDPNYDMAEPLGAESPDVKCMITEISEAERMTILGEFPDVQHRLTCLPDETRLKHHARIRVIKGPAGVSADETYEVVMPPAVRSEIGHDRGFFRWAYVRKRAG